MGLGWVQFSLQEESFVIFIFSTTGDGEPTDTALKVRNDMIHSIKIRGNLSFTKQKLLRLVEVVVDLS